MSATHIITTSLVNEDTDILFSEWHEEIGPDWRDDGSWLFDDDGRLDMGEVFRASREEWGACRASVYVDPAAGGPPIKVGWYFVKRDEYDRGEGTYLRGAWVTVRELAS